MAARLNAGEADKRVGTAIMLRVNRGDKFKISADAFFADSYVQEDDVSTSDVLEGLMGALLGGGTYGGIPTSELPESSQLIQNAFSNPQLLTELEGIISTNNNVNAPKAHLNVLFFDEGMQFIAENSGSVQVPSSTTGFTTIDPSTVMDASVLVPGGYINTLNPGFMIVYVDNQSIGKDVWFDNIAVGHYTSDVIEEDHYYPFGLTLETTLNQMGIPVNNKKYQGIELEKHFGLETYETFYRGLDPQLGRFNSIDPKAEKHYEFTPYVSMGDNPVRFKDPDGDDWWEETKFAIRHPLIAAAIGPSSPGATNISNNATRFSTRGASTASEESVLGTNKDNAGDQVNGFRHVLWQAKITSEFGTDIANKVGRSHEKDGSAIDGVPEYKLQIQSFNTLEDVDQSIDLANNKIGRSIGEANSGIGMKDLALKVVDKFKTDGIWTATQVGDGIYRMAKTTITDEQYNALKAVFQKLNNDGFTEGEQNSINKKAQKEQGNHVK